jgi:hypothetical protein
LPVAPEEVKTQNIKLKEYLAIWDTGAMDSAITKKIVDDLKLQPTGVREIRHAGGKSSNKGVLSLITSHV